MIQKQSQGQKAILTYINSRMVSQIMMDQSHRIRSFHPEKKVPAEETPPKTSKHLRSSLIKITTKRGREGAIACIANTTATQAKITGAGRSQTPYYIRKFVHVGKGREQHVQSSQNLSNLQQQQYRSTILPITGYSLWPRIEREPDLMSLSWFPGFSRFLRERE